KTLLATKGQLTEDQARAMVNYDRLSDALLAVKMAETPPFVMCADEAERNRARYASFETFVESTHRVDHPVPTPWTLAIFLHDIRESGTIVPIQDVFERVVEVGRA
ncbi:unnamed protein product, partial [Ectocarpus fasciculatus]